MPAEKKREIINNLRASLAEAGESIQRANEIMQFAKIQLKENDKVIQRLTNCPLAAIEEEYDYDRLCILHDGNQAVIKSIASEHYDQVTKGEA